MKPIDFTMKTAVLNCSELGILDFNLDSFMPPFHTSSDKINTFKIPHQILKLMFHCGNLANLNKA